MSSDNLVDDAFERMLKNDEEIVNYIDEDGNVGQRIQKKEYKKTIDDKGVVEKVQFSLDKESLDRSLMGELDRTKEELEQARRDVASMRDTKRGGGQVQLREPKNYESFKSAGEMVDDLYERVAKGDKKAEKDLDKMWSKLVNTLDHMEGKTHAITACPNCGRGVDMLHKNQCPWCQYDLVSYRKSGGEMF